MWLWILVSGWIVSGLAGAYVADQRGRPPIEGLMLGLLLGPFGAVAAGTLPEREREPGRPSFPARMLDKFFE